MLLMFQTKNEIREERGSESQCSGYVKLLMYAGEKTLYNRREKVMSSFKSVRDMQP